MGRCGPFLIIRNAHIPAAHTRCSRERLAFLALAHRLGFNPRVAGIPIRTVHWTALRVKDTRRAIRKTWRMRSICRGPRAIALQLPLCTTFRAHVKREEWVVRILSIPAFASQLSQLLLSTIEAISCTQQLRPER